MVWVVPSKELLGFCASVAALQLPFPGVVIRTAVRRGCQSQYGTKKSPFFLEVADFPVQIKDTVNDPRYSIQGPCYSI